MSGSSSHNNSDKNWSLPEFGLVNHTQHSTKKRLKANIPFLVKNEQTQQIQYETELKKGYKQGYEEALSKATPEINKKLAQLSTLIAELSSYKNSIDEKLKEDIQQFVLLICEKVLMDKMHESSDAICNIIRRALEVIEGNSLVVKLYCNETLYLTLFNQSSTLTSPNVTIEKDNTLTDFNFRVESDKQFLEFNLQESINEIVDRTKDFIIGTSAK